MVADYDRESFSKAVHHLLRPEVNLAMRRRALATSSLFSATGAAEWIWQSLALGRAIDGRFAGLSAPGSLASHATL
jgi:hypothetical protein